MTVYDLGDDCLVVDRAGASPAPTRNNHPDTGPGNGGRPGPCNDEPTVTFKACGCGVLASESCDCADLAAQLEAHLCQSIWFQWDRRAA